MWILFSSLGYCKACIPASRGGLWRGLLHLTRRLSWWRVSHIWLACQPRTSIRCRFIQARTLLCNISSIRSNPEWKRWIWCSTPSVHRSYCSCVHCHPQSSTNCLPGNWSAPECSKWSTYNLFFLKEIPKGDPSLRYRTQGSKPGREPPGQWPLPLRYELLGNIVCCCMSDMASCPVNSNYIIPRQPN